MTERSAPLLHRDDPDKSPLTGHIKVTRQDWLNLARDVLVNEGVGEVKILDLATRLGVSRSSFYWYFEDRSDLQNALLEEWETRNTSQIISHCRLPARNVTEAACNFFRCFLDPAKFDSGLDFAVREWSRRDPAIRSRVDSADAARIDAVTELFARHGYSPVDADARARILYFMQLGYHALEVRETIETRMSRLAPYVQGFTGQEPDLDAIEEFLDYVRRLGVS